MIPVVIDGLMFGLQLSLLAVGITLIFGFAEILNLAHGEFATMAGILTLVLMGLGLGILPSTAAAILLVGLIGIAVEKTCLIPAYRSRGETRIFVGLFITLGLGLAIHGLIGVKFSVFYLSVPFPIESVKLFGMTLRASALAAGAMSAIALIALGLFLKNTLVGKAIRALVQNEAGACLCGINPERLRTLVFFLGATMAGFAGIMRGLSAVLPPEAGIELTTMALVVCVVGGVRSVYGTIVAGIVLGVIHALASYLIGTYMALVIFFFAAISMIVMRRERMVRV